MKRRLSAFLSFKSFSISLDLILLAAAYQHVAYIYNRLWIWRQGPGAETLRLAMENPKLMETSHRRTGGIQEEEAHKATDFVADAKRRRSIKPPTCQGINQCLL
jgi:hypothetical protein